MTARRIAITGPTSGIGRASCFALAAQGAHLILFCRNQEKGDALVQELLEQGAQPPELIPMDLADLGSVRRAASAVAELDTPVDVLLNNAGVVNLKRRVTVDGFEETLAVNHLAPFLLTGLLLPQLQRADRARIVNVSSDAHMFVRHMHFGDMQAERNYRVFREYGRSKLANILFTRELATRLGGGQVGSDTMSVNCLHPGAVATALGKNNGGIAGRILPPLLRPFFLSPEQGAETSVYLCSSEEVEGVSGAYFVKCRERSPKPWATDAQAARELWDFSEQCVDFRYPL